MGTVVRSTWEAEASIMCNMMSGAEKAGRSLSTGGPRVGYAPVDGLTREAGRTPIPPPWRNDSSGSSSPAMACASASYSPGGHALNAYSSFLHEESSASQQQGTTLQATKTPSPDQVARGFSAGGTALNGYDPMTPVSVRCARDYSTGGTARGAYDPLLEQLRANSALSAVSLNEQSIRSDIDPSLRSDAATTPSAT